MRVEDCFSQTYEEARAKFRDAAQQAGATLSEYRHPLKGVSGEDLATDVAVLGSPSATRGVLVVSGTHGVEGYCGSGCQVAMMRGGVFAAFPEDCAILLVHAINPYGFSHLRRVNEDNVDCNRNFVDAGVRPANPAYAEVHPWLVPADWDGPSRRAADAEIAAFVAARGLKTFQAAVTGGQYDYPDGMFYGGSEPVWSNRTFRQLLRDSVGGMDQLMFIDIHTGLGPSGHGELIFIGDAEDDLHRARAAFGPDVTSINQGTSTSSPVTGVLAEAVRAQVGAAGVTAIALEYGTHPLERVLAALRADNWLHARGNLASASARQIRTEMRNAFYVDTTEWKEAVTARGFDVIAKIQAYLGGGSVRARRPDGS